MVKKTFDPFKNPQLDEEEKELLRSFEAGEWKPVKNFEQRKAELVAAAKATVAKRRNINIRLSEQTLMTLKQKAMEEGLPYQTLVGSILHKYATGKLKSVTS